MLNFETYEFRLFGSEKKVNHRKFGRYDMFFSCEMVINNQLIIS